MKGSRTTLALAAVLLGCAPDRMAGGGGVDAEGFTLAGLARYADGSPARSARVRIRSWDFLVADTVFHSGTGQREGDFGETFTDSSGRFRTDSLSEGTYSVEVLDSNSKAVLFPVAALGPARIISREDTLQGTGWVQGVVMGEGGKAIAGAQVQIYGWDRQVRSDDSGRFSLVRVPRGLHVIRISPPADSLAALEIAEVNMAPDGRVDLGSLVLATAVPNLLGHWRFDEGKGIVASEATGKSGRANLSGALWVTGAFGFALDLPDRAHAVVAKSRAFGLNIGAGVDFTVSAWIKAGETLDAGPRRIIDTRSAYNAGGYALTLLPGGRLELLVQNGEDGLIQRCAGGLGLADGAWHRVAGVRQGNRIRLLADGVWLDSVEVIAGTLTFGNPFYMGAREGRSEFLAGQLDDIRLYNRALEAKELPGL
jgi:hypothetical protein